MRIHVKLFAAVRDAIGRDEVTLDLPDANPTVANLRKCLAAKYPSVAPMLAHTLFAVDTNYATEKTPLRESSEVACIPPVSGG